VIRVPFYDVREAALAIQGVVAGMDAAAYDANEMAQSAVERKFEIIGEALNQLAKLDATLAARIPELAQIVAFRNQLIHGYATVRVGTVWNVMRNTLPPLLAVVDVLLSELGQP
jgi:uncharacterized protein with HEPN domain